jgi:hypothetical protein
MFMKPSPASPYDQIVGGELLTSVLALFSCCQHVSASWEVAIGHRRRYFIAHCRK